MAKKKAELIVSLVDKLSGPARALTGTLDRLTAAQNRNNARLDAIRGRMLEAGAVAYGLARAISAPIRAATEFETVLEDAAQKIDLPADKLQELGSDIRQVARDTTQSARQMAEAFDILAGKGANQSDALTMLEPIGKAATAYRADINDLANASYAALDNLKIPADQLGQALDVMAQAGKLGSFEISDLAKHLPSLGAAYQGLGQTGVAALSDLAAAAQVVRTGTGSSDAAGTNLANILQKINAPQTVKAFKKMGVNLERELQRATEHGLSPIEAIAEITNQTLKGDLSKLGYLFSDAQVQQGLRPLLQNMELYREIRAEALKAQGTVSADYQRRLKTGAIAGIRFANAMENINTSIGAALLPAVAELGEKLVPLIDRMATFAEQNPKLTQTVVALTTGLVGLRVAALAAQFGFLWMKGGALTAAIGGLKGVRAAVIGADKAFRAFRAAATGATMLGAVGGGGVFSGLVAGAGSAVTGIIAAFSGLAAGVAAVTAPVWGVVALLTAAVVGVGLTIYNYWVPISEWVSGFVSVISGALGDVISEVAAFGGRIASAVGGWATNKVLDFAEWMGFDRATIEAAINEAIAGLTAAKDRIVAIVKAIPSAVAGWISDIFTMNEYSDEATAGFRSAGEQAGQALVDAVKRAIDGLIEWFKSLPKRIIDAIGSIDISSLIKFPSMPSWLGGGGGATEIPGRAAGGPVRAGMPYMVGELGPELIIPRQNGLVVPNHALAAMSARGFPMEGGRAAGGVAEFSQHNVININGSNLDANTLAGMAADEVSARSRQVFNSVFLGRH